MILRAEDPVQAKIHIDTEAGHALQACCSGFNVRIADKVWSYEHPDSRAAVHGRCWRDWCEKECFVDFQ